MMNKRIFIILFVCCLVTFMPPSFSMTEAVSADTEELIRLSDEPMETATGYILSMMPHKTDGRLRISRPAGYSLKETNRRLYFALRSRITEVAAGRESSTKFFIPAETIFDPCQFTAEDLGLETLTDGSGGVTEEAQEAFETKLAEMRGTIDFPQVMTCLMADCPYELYWFNKSYYTPKDDFGMEAAADGSRLAISGNYSVTLVVSKDYATWEITDGETVYSRTEVDTSYGQAVTRAAENAQGILDQYSDSTDYEKLCGYRDSICALADYNYDATGPDVSYGDPWQMVWVFDGKPNTKVVCEGYAKAFQYLCELGTAKAVTISVQGTIGKEKHMWNIVTIDGRNYLTDLTNCDAGYDMFLKGYTDGGIDSGYYILNGQGTTRYTYNRGLTGRTDSELTLSRWDYRPGSSEGIAALPAGLTELGEDVFGGTQVEEIRMTEKVTEIADEAFRGIETQIVIRAPGGSAAEKYAEEKGIRFEEQ